MGVSSNVKRIRTPTQSRGRGTHHFAIDGLVEWDKSAAGLAKSRWPYPTADVVGVIERFTFARGEAISNREARGRDAISVRLGNSKSQVARASQ